MQSLGALPGSRHASSQAQHSVNLRVVNTCHADTMQVEALETLVPPLMGDPPGRRTPSAGDGPSAAPDPHGRSLLSLFILTGGASACDRQYSCALSRCSALGSSGTLRLLPPFRTAARSAGELLLVTQCRSHQHLRSSLNHCRQPCRRRRRSAACSHAPFPPGWARQPSSQR